MIGFPCLEKRAGADGQVRYRLGHPLVYRYLEFVAGRARPNTVRAVTFDLKTFFSVILKDPEEVKAVGVFDFLAHQRGDRTVVRLADRESGPAARTIARRISSISGFYAYLLARDDTKVTANPGPSGIADPPARRDSQVPVGAAGSCSSHASEDPRPGRSGQAAEGA